MQARFTATPRPQNEGWTGGAWVNVRCHHNKGAECTGENTASVIKGLPRPAPHCGVCSKVRMRSAARRQFRYVLRWPGVIDCYRLAVGHLQTP